MKLAAAWRRVLDYVLGIRLANFFHFREDAWHILVHAWSARLAYVLGFINIVDYSFYYFLGYLPLPQWVLGLISALIGVLIPYARVVVQCKISGESPNADQ